MVNNNDTKNPVTKSPAKGKEIPKNTPKNVPKKKTEKFDVNDLWVRTRDYLISVYNELKKVHWPDRKALGAYTIVVLVSVALVSALMYLFDGMLGYLLGLLFKAFA